MDHHARTTGNVFLVYTTSSVIAHLVSKEFFAMVRMLFGQLNLKISPMSGADSGFFAKKGGKYLQSKLGF